MTRLQHVLAIVSLLCMGCGGTAGEGTAPNEDTTQTDTSTPPVDPCDPANITDPAITGLVYVDEDESSLTHYIQEMDAGVDSPLAGSDVRLVGADLDQTLATCDDGSFAFSALADGPYVVHVTATEDRGCTSANCAPQFANAIASGEVTILTVGDSVPVVSPGGAPLFPQRVADMLAPLATVTNQNIAVGGTTTLDWLPGEGLFENTLSPKLADADVVVVSLGGNDLQFFVQDSMGSGDLLGAAATFPGFIDGVLANGLTIIQEIQARAPHVDIVYCVYMNYLNTSEMQGLLGGFYDLAQGLLVGALDSVRTQFSAVDGVVLADMSSALGDELLDNYLMDFVHLSDQGHEFYAREVFMALGGAIVGDEPLGLDRLFGVQPATQ